MIQKADHSKTWWVGVHILRDSQNDTVVVGLQENFTVLSMGFFFFNSAIALNI